jgi:hypothetical protein
MTGPRSCHQRDTEHRRVTPPPPSGRRRRAIVAGVAIVSTLASCGGSASSTPDATAGAPEEFGLSLADLTTRIEDTEASIATCMRDAGFEYVALDFATVKQAMDSDQTATGLSDEEYVAQYGLGVTTQFDKPLVVFSAGPQNNAYLDGLPESDQVAFRRTLWGEAPDWNHARALEEEDFSETGGCTRAAAEQLYSPDELSGTYVNPADVRIEQDPRMVDAIAAWSGCVAAEGYDYDHPDRVTEDLQQRLDTIAQGQDPATLAGPALAALEELQGEELAIAVLTTTCEEEFVEPVQAEVESEIYGDVAQ